MPLPSPQHPSTRAIPSRRSLYRRALLRKALAGLLTIIAVWLFTTVLGLTRGAEASAWVAIRDMEAGEQLTENDVRSVPIEASLLTPAANAITREYLASGNVLTAPITSGEVVTASRLRAGSHVDIHSPSNGAVIAADVPVLQVDTPTGDSDTKTAGAILDVPADRAPQLMATLGTATHDGGAVTLAIRSR
ncbi:Flp pilus assembly protein CpaB [Dermatophilus congolensis]|uniref:Flp pilus assembly protein CpaB n=1 Tax=Dermatophilus congolensis TaxID=1863 RepID=A0A239VU18_9MICO|nr:SAF domain-containing protein [Dermatophilus congolensis]SNV25300.1 Flp pilus assembly protein CpaB [Dermatophilus congolensis]